MLVALVCVMMVHASGLAQSGIADVLREAASRQEQGVSGCRIVYGLMESEIRAAEKFENLMTQLVTERNRLLSDGAAFSAYPEDVRASFVEDLLRQRDWFADVLENSRGHEELIETAAGFEGRIELVYDKDAKALRVTREDERDHQTFLGTVDPASAFRVHLEMNLPPRRSLQVLRHDRPTAPEHDLERNRAATTSLQPDRARRDWLVQSLGIPLIEWELLRNPVISSSGTEIHISSVSPEGIRWECTVDRTLDFKVTSMRTGFKQREHRVVALMDYVRINDVWLPTRSEVTEYDVMGDGKLLNRRVLTLREFHSNTRMSVEEVLDEPPDAQEGIDSPHGSEQQPQ
ncbi:MAG: hypothetical protein KF858_03320 [Candidatus Sumerlaeia bacterium]|nr:hypothetical protein [Candidatus Sumerlaeia bacterium]